MQGHEFELLHVAFGPDGSHIVTSSADNTARIWDIATGKQLCILGSVDKMIVEDIETIRQNFFAPDGPLFQDYQMVADGHTDNINCAVFSSDGQRVLTVSDDNTGQIWDANTGKQLAVLKGHKNSIHYADFSPDGQHIITASSDKTVRKWRFFPDTQFLIDYANKIIPYRLTCEERQKYFLEVTEECCFVADKNIKGIYQGECKNGKAHGYGKSVGKNTYEGNFMQGYMHGKGIYTWRDGTQYKGEFENNKEKDIGIIFGDVDGWYKRGSTLYGQRKLNDAIDAYQKQVEIKPTHKNAWCDMGITLTQQEKLDEAIEAFKEQIEVKPDHESAWFCIGNILTIQGKFEDSIIAYKNVGKGQNYLTAQTNIATILCEQGKFDEAIEHLHDLPTKNEDEKLHLLLIGADLLFYYKRHDQAMRIYNQALEQHPDNMNLLNIMTNAFWKQDKLNQAADTFAKGLAVQPSNLTLLSNDAELALVQGDIARCQKRIETALPLLTPKDQTVAIIPFISWLANPEQGWKKIMAAITELDPEVTYTWNFSTMQPAIERLDESTRQTAQHFIAFFENRIDFLTLKSELAEKR